MTALIIAYMIIGATFSAWIILEHVVDDGEPFVRRWGVMPVLGAIIALAAAVKRFKKAGGKVEKLPIRALDNRREIIGCA